MRPFKKFDWQRLQNKRFANLVAFAGATIFAVSFAWSLAAQPAYLGILLFVGGIGGTIAIVGHAAFTPDPPPRPPRRSRTAARPSYRPIRR